MHKCPTYCTVSLASFLKKQANLCPVYSFILICEEGALLWCSGATPGLGTTRYRSMLRFPYAMHALQASEYLPGPYYILLICWFCKYPPLLPPPLPAIFFFSFLPNLVSGPYPVVVLRNYSWLSVLRGPYEVLGIEPKLAACKARALPLILIYFCPHFLSFKKISYFVGGGSHGWGAWELYPTLQGLLLAVLRRPWCVKIKLRSPEKKIRAL